VGGEGRGGGRGGRGGGGLSCVPKRPRLTIFLELNAKDKRNI